MNYKNLIEEFFENEKIFLDHRKSLIVFLGSFADFRLRVLSVFPKGSLWDRTFPKEGSFPNSTSLLSPRSEDSNVTTTM